ncbi:probable acyl-activating enzyme 17, peroxisomal [Helianthus annuus]|uniref:probable acyl-activating enzyme 17, peroxisomal n=1 Tax=Helianthus annuus TaxID=4232 RepID=UPI000B8FE586|nr:probable acyl-activating enzyme 17, peroxisomal [Helianthus annuus]
MPMDVKLVVIHLAIVFSGYVVVSIADSFAASEISMRLVLSKAKAIFTQDLIIRGDRSISLYREHRVLCETVSEESLMDCLNTNTSAACQLIPQNCRSSKNIAKQRFGPNGLKSFEVFSLS